MHESVKLEKRTSMKLHLSFAEQDHRKSWVKWGRLKDV